MRLKNKFNIFPIKISNYIVCVICDNLLTYNVYLVLSCYNRNVFTMN